MTVPKATTSEAAPTCSLVRKRSTKQDRAEVRELGDDHRTAQPVEAAAQMLLMTVHTR